MDDHERWHFAARAGAAISHRTGRRRRAGVDDFPGAFMLRHTVSLDVRVTSSEGLGAPPGSFFRHESAQIAHSQ